MTTAAIPCPLPSRVLSFGRWLQRWHAQTGEVSPSTRYLAKKQGVTERTIYNWLRRLKDAGYIVCEVLEGVEREIIPAAPIPSSRRRLSGVRQGERSGVVSGASPYSVSDAVTHRDASRKDAPPTPKAEPRPAADPAVVALLTQRHVAEPVARQLAATDPQECKRQAAVIEQRKPRNLPALLVHAIKHRLELPARCERTTAQERERPRRYVSAKDIPKPAGALPAGGAERPQPPAVNGLTGKAAFDSLRATMRLGGKAQR